MSAHDHLNPHQLRMFMTHREIDAGWKHSSGDSHDARDEHGNDLGRLETTAEVGARKLAESKLSPREYHEAQNGGVTESSSHPGFGDSWYERQAERSDAPRYPSTTALGHSPTTTDWDDYESDEGDFYERRAQSSLDRHRARFDGPSLHASIAAEGVRNPIHLSFERKEGESKLELAGGNHRQAAGLDAAPDRYAPVLYHNTMEEAQNRAPVKIGGKMMNLGKPRGVLGPKGQVVYPYD